jgi:putative ABC transport system permease protein
MQATTDKAADGAPTPANASRLPAVLGLKQLFVGSSLVIVFGGFFMTRMGLYQLATHLLFACVRATAQLFLLGALMLQKLFGTTKPAIVWTWIVGVGLLAAQEASSRVEYTYDKLGRHMTISVLTSGLGILSLALVGEVFGNIEPWFQPRTLIPVAGMIFGNTLPAVSLGASSLTKEFSTSSAQLELRLSLGANSHEAIMPIVRNSLQSALTPTVNSLAATGIVHLPGMMTGQVLSGQSPTQAAAYQVLILFLITSTACSTVQMLSSFVSHELMNMKDVRLQTSGLTRVTNGKFFTLKAPIQSAKNVAASWFQPAEVVKVTNTPLSVMRMPSVVPLGSVADKDAGTFPVLKVAKIRVERSNMEVSFNLSANDRIGITGTTGIGKTQLLRTISGLEHMEGTMVLNGVSSTALKWPEWRRQVSWVSQDRTTLDGTPREFFEEVRSFHSQKRERLGRYPEEIAAKWGLSASAFDRPWSTLSGGEVQRASLAIALSFEPEVLLLDEITAGLDEKTTLAVENTLLSTGVPIVMVTHSQAQLERFCTHHMDLNEARPIID